MNRQLSDRPLRLLRCMANQLQPTGQLLPDNPRQAVESVFAVQAQELPSALLSLRARRRDPPVRARLEVAALRQAKRLPYAGQATVHLLYRAALEGLLCIGELRGSKPTYVSFESWTGGLQPVPSDDALSRLALRYPA